MKYEIRHWQDNEYTVYEKDSYGIISNHYAFRGTLEEVNAWISLKEKGYDF